MDKRLLLIDDDISAGPETTGYMAYYAAALRDRGYQLTEANNIDQALEKVAAGPFDLILLDVMMPPGKSLADVDTSWGVRTGVVFADRLAQTHPQTPVVILTNVENPAIMQALRGKPNVKRILQKTDYPPFAAAEEVKEILGD